MAWCGVPVHSPLHDKLRVKLLLSIFISVIELQFKSKYSPNFNLVLLSIHPRWFTPICLYSWQKILISVLPHKIDSLPCPRHVKVTTAIKGSHVSSKWPCQHISSSSLLLKKHQDLGKTGCKEVWRRNCTLKICWSFRVKYMILSVLNHTSGSGV